MLTATKVISVGNSAGIIIPKEMLSRLKVEKGNTVYLSETPNGLRVTPYDEEFAVKMAGRRNTVPR
ncbi:MAG TPA: AbrB/MazE/SpoVT family DNA-binding domain-containing protein [Terracidiphilus sp.]|jgi:putative addiction module antidote